MAELIGTLSKMTLIVSRKRFQDRDGILHDTVGVDIGGEVSLPPDAVPEDVRDAWDAWFTVSANASLEEKWAEIAKNKPAPQEIQPAPVEQTRVSVDDDGKEYKTIEVDHFEITVGSDNIRTCKVFGGPYKKFGVRCWPEPLEGVGIKLDILEAGKFMLPPGYTKAKVLMVDDKPKKVWKFER